MGIRERKKIARSEIRMAGGGARKCAGSLQRGGSRKRTLKSLILEEEGTRKKERDRKEEGARYPAEFMRRFLHRVELRVSRVCFGYALSDNAIIETIRR